MSMQKDKHGKAMSYILKTLMVNMPKWFSVEEKIRAEQQEEIAVIKKFTGVLDQSLFHKNK
jgi:hypothetical protein